MYRQQNIENTHQEIYKTFQDEYKMQKMGAWQRLYEKILEQKRWSQHLLTIVRDFIKISNGMNKQQEIKRIIIHTKRLTQYEFTEDLSNVIQYYSEQIEKKFDDQAQGLVIPKDINDLDIEEQPEELLFYAYNIEEKQQRDKAKQILKLKLDCYKTIIDTVKVFNKLEQDFINANYKLIDFFEKYERKQELARFVLASSKSLNEIKQTLIVNLQKYPNYIDPRTKEVQSNLLDIRFRLYEVCKKLGLGQSCLKCMEDVRLLINLRANKKDETKKRYISMYYEYLSEIFWQSQYYVYHAFFFMNHYNIFAKYNIEEGEDINTLTTAKADKVVLSVLCIPYNTADVKIQGDKWYKLREFILESSKYVPSAEDMIKIVKNNNILDFCSPEVQALYNVTANTQLNIFSVSKQLQTATSTITNPDQQVFLPLIKERVAYKVMLQLSKIYRTLKFERLTQIINFFEQQALITMLLEAHQLQTIKSQIDFRNNTIIFGKKQKLENTSDTLLLITEKCKRTVLSFQEQDQAQNTEFLFSTAEKEVQDSLKTIKRTKVRLQRWNMDAQNEQDREKIRIQQYEEEKARRELERKKLLEQRIQVKKQEKINSINKEIDEIMKIKQKQVAKIGGKLIEDLDDEDKLDLDRASLIELKEKIIESQKNDVEERARKKFQKYDFICREQRIREDKKLEDIESNLDELQKAIKNSEEIFNNNLELKQKVAITSEFKMKFFNKVMELRENKYTKNIESFKQQCEQFRKEIEKKALEYLKEYEKQLEEERLALESQNVEEQENKINDTNQFMRRNSNVKVEQIQIVDSDEEERNKSGGFGGFKKGGALPVQPSTETETKPSADFGFKKGALLGQQQQQQPLRDTGDFKKGETGGEFKKGVMTKGAAIVRDQPLKKLGETTSNSESWNKRTIPQDNTAQKKTFGFGDKKKIDNNDDSWNQVKKGGNNKDFGGFRKGGK